MLLSLCLSLTERDQRISDLIDALDSQTFQDWELVVRIDKERALTPDLSQDEQQQLATSVLQTRAQADARIRWQLSDPSCGMLANLNQCLQNAKGHYVKIMHPAEILLPGALQEIIKQFETRDDLDAVTFRMDYPVAGQLMSATSTQLDPFAPILDSRRKEFTERLLGRAHDLAVSECAFKMPDRIPLFDKHFSYFSEELFLQPILRDAKSVHLSDHLSRLEGATDAPAKEIELQFFLLIGEISLLPAFLQPNQLSASFAEHAASIRYELETQLFDQFGISLLELLTRGSPPLVGLERHALEQRAVALAAGAYQRLVDVRDLSHMLSQKSVKVEELKLRKEQAQHELGGLLSSRSWQLSEPLRKAKEHAAKVASFLKRNANDQS